MCPYIEKGDGRCSHTLNLNNIERAVGLCSYQFKACPIYLRLKACDCRLRPSKRLIQPLKA